MVTFILHAPCGKNLITGVSFLGVGTIFVSKAEERVKGLTTATSILVTAAVGMMVDLRFYLLASCLTLLVVLVLYVLGIIERKLEARSQR